MSRCWDTLARVIVLLMILSTSLFLLGDKDRFVVAPSTLYECSSDIGAAANDSDPIALVTPGEAGIAITFNGWAVDEWYSIRSLLNTYAAKVTFFVGNVSSLSSEDFEKLRVLKDYGHEIGIQGLGYVDAVEYIRNNSLQAYISDEITPAIDLMSENELLPTSFAYPFGSRNSTTDVELLKYFIRLRATAYTSNTTRIVDLNKAYYKWQNESLIRGVGIDTEYGNTVDEVIQGMERAQQSNEVIILYGHTPTYDSPDYGTPVEKLVSILEAAQTMNLVFYRVSDLVLSSTDTTTTPTDNGDTRNTNSALGLSDIVVSILISCVGVLLLWAVVTIVFRDEKSWHSHSS